jgi:NADPH-dependent curcumin reductase CurA
MTAYTSIKKIAEPKAGEVAFVSGAAGAVGLVAGQLLKHVYGCKVIGSAGTEDKVCGVGSRCLDLLNSCWQQLQ